MSTDSPRRIGRPPVYSKADVLNAGIEHYRNTGKLPVRSKSNAELGFSDTVVLRHYQTWKNYVSTVKSTAARRKSNVVPIKPDVVVEAPKPSKRHGNRHYHAWNPEKILDAGVAHFNATGTLPVHRQATATLPSATTVARYFGSLGKYNEALADRLGITLTYQQRPRKAKSNPKVVEPTPVIETEKVTDQVKPSLFHRFTRWFHAE